MQQPDFFKFPFESIHGLFGVFGGVQMQGAGGEDDASVGEVSEAGLSDTGINADFQEGGEAMRDLGRQNAWGDVDKLEDVEKKFGMGQAEGEEGWAATLPETVRQKQSGLDVRMMHLQELEELYVTITMRLQEAKEASQGL